MLYSKINSSNKFQISRFHHLYQFSDEKFISNRIYFEEKPKKFFNLGIGNFQIFFRNSYIPKILPQLFKIFLTFLKNMEKILQESTSFQYTIKKKYYINLEKNNQKR